MGSGKDFRRFLEQEERLLRQALRHEEAVLRLKLFTPLVLGFLVLVVALVHPGAQPLLRDLLHAFLEYARTIGHR
jgi:hypothetical protein